MALTAGERARVGPKDGAAASATVSIDPIGSIAAHVASVPQGQGHRTVLAQVIAGVLGVELDDVTVNVEHDTQKDPWSIAAGNYSSRFSGAVAGAAHLAAMKLRERLARIASTGLNATPEALVFAGGRIFAADNPENAIPLRRAAGIAHWSPGSLPEHAEPELRETIFWSMPGLDPPDEDDRVNSSGAYGFIFDMCGVEVDDTGRVRIDGTRFGEAIRRRPGRNHRRRRSPDRSRPRGPVADPARRGAARARHSRVQVARCEGRPLLRRRRERGHRPGARPVPRVGRPLRP